MQKILNLVTALFLGGTMPQVSLSSQVSDKFITHGQKTKLDLNALKSRLKTRKDLTLSYQEEIELLEELSNFELGYFLLENKGLNGYWTAYLIIHAPQKDNLSPLESWIIHKAPVVKATRERYGFFKQELQKRLKKGIKIASIPCGLMDDLLSLDYSSAPDIELVGIDLDQQSLELARQNAHGYGYKNVSFIHKDAWDLNITDEFDVITSNGLNIYQKDDQKVIELYKKFCQALKPEGILITSFLTPPPVLSKESPWVNFRQEDLLKQKAIFGDIVEATWQSFRTEKDTRNQLEQAGFRVLEVIYDTQRMFPTIIAQKVNTR